MRVVSKEEKKKRGCKYCLDNKHVKGVGNMCKHNECPYHELDEFETYEDFYKTNAGILEELLGEE